MQRLALVLLYSMCAVPVWAAFDSALAPYPYLRKEPYDERVEALLAKVQANAPKDGVFAATVAWSADPAMKLDTEVDRYGPFSSKSCANWYPAAKSGYWASGEYSLYTQGANFRMEKATDKLSPPDWWQKDGEHIYSRAFFVDWPTVWRFHQDALAADMLGYCEGLGLLLWACNPAEYLRRADNLALGAERVVGGKTCVMLIATPKCVDTPRLVGTSESVKQLSRWMSQQSIVTYYIDASMGAIIGADFAFLAVEERVTADGCVAAAQQSGLIVSCVADTVVTNNGSVIPSAITGRVLYGGKLLRQLVMTVSPGQAGGIPASLELPSGKLLVDPWPQYQPEVYAQAVAEGRGTSAEVIGLARALCGEADIGLGETALLEAVELLAAGPAYPAASPGAPDWELGTALAALFERYTVAQIEAFWDRVPRNAAWFDVTARAVRTYQLRHSGDAQKIDLLLAKFQTQFGDARKAQETREQLLQYRDFLQTELKKATESGQTAKAEHARALLAEVEGQIAKQ